MSEDRRTKAQLVEALNKANRDIFPGTGVMGRVAAAATVAPEILKEKPGWKERAA